MSTPPMTAKELEKRLAAKAIYVDVRRTREGNFVIEIDGGTTLAQVRAVGEILGTDDVTLHALCWDKGSSVRLTTVPKKPSELCPSTCTRCGQPVRLCLGVEYYCQGIK